MRRKIGQPTFPNLFFKDSTLSVPGYTFEKVISPFTLFKATIYNTSRLSLGEILVA
jgi:hypothetical protein